MSQRIVCCCLTYIGTIMMSAVKYDNRMLEVKALQIDIFSSSEIRCLHLDIEGVPYKMHHSFHNLNIFTQLLIVYCVCRNHKDNTLIRCRDESASRCLLLVIVIKMYDNNLMIGSLWFGLHPSGHPFLYI